MPEFREDGKFDGLSAEEKAAMILPHLSEDTPVTIHQIKAATGLSVDQIHGGIQFLRRESGCVVYDSSKRTYRLAVKAEEVSQYAVARMGHWQTQMLVIQREMALAEKLHLLGHEAPRVQQVAKILGNLIDVLKLDDIIAKDIERKEREIAKREAKLVKTGRSRRRVPA